MHKLSIHWFRQDLRLQENPSLNFLLNNSESIILLYIVDTSQKNEWGMGAASKWWLHHSLNKLNDDLISKGSNLIVRRGDPLKILEEISKENDISLISWNRTYEPYSIDRDTKIKSNLKKLNITCESFNSSLLMEPWEYQNKSGKPYKVFTPFWNNLQKILHPKAPLKKIIQIKTPGTIYSLKIEDLNLLPKIKWDKDFYSQWEPGELGAQNNLTHFLKNIDHYKDERDYPSNLATSKLSPHLHFGEISPREIWRLTEQSFKAGDSKTIEPFLRQLAWREFATQLLFHFPKSTKEPLRLEFTKFPWTNNKKHLELWKKGATGYPIIDAGMRELWATGTMHNRVRMLVGSFLVKNLLIHWVKGAEWFWDTLVDADLANNTMGWQWVAGSGADAAPYFRIFNPITQSEKFDKEGLYIKKWVPELGEMPAKIIHAPWLQSDETLASYNVFLDKNYPKPIIQLKETRENALEAYQELKKK